MSNCPPGRRSCSTPTASPRRATTPGVQFGEDGLLKVLAGSDCLTAGGTVAAVHDAVEAHLSGSRHGADDLAVLALRC